MGSLQEEYLKLVMELDEVLVECEKILEGASEGTLRIIHNKNTAQYYHRQRGNDTEGRYERTF